MILHITRRRDWEAARHAGRYAADSLSTEGFIHCSEPRQVTAVANARFRGQAGLVLLWIDPAKLAAPLRYENREGGVDLVPHVYGPIELDAVVKVTTFEPESDGTFTAELLERRRSE